MALLITLTLACHDDGFGARIEGDRFVGLTVFSGPAFAALVAATVAGWVTLGIAMITRARNRPFVTAALLSAALVASCCSWTRSLSITEFRVVERFRAASGERYVVLDRPGEWHEWTLGHVEARRMFTDELSLLAHGPGRYFDHWIEEGPGGAIEVWGRDVYGDDRRLYEHRGTPAPLQPNEGGRARDHDR